MKNKRFVLDTNLMVSALIIPSSISRRTLEMADVIGNLIFSKETLDELNEVLIRSKFDKYISLNDRIEFIERLEARSEVVVIKSEFTDCRDPKDNKFLNLAYDGDASCIITGDNDLLVLNPFRKISIITASAFLKTS